MNEYYGIYETITKRWIQSGNAIVYYPIKEIAEAHLEMVKSPNYDFVIKKFNKEIIKKKTK